MHSIVKGISITPAMYIAWFVTSSPALARHWTQKKAEPQPKVSGIIGNRHMKKGEMSKGDMNAVLDYYIRGDSESCTNAKQRKSRRTSELKTNVLKDSAKGVTPSTKVAKRTNKVAKSEHPKCDTDVAKVELSALFAIAAVCAVAAGYWRWRSRVKDEATFGIDTEIQNFSPIRDGNIQEKEEEKEYIRMEAMRRIQVAKKKEEEFRSRSQLVGNSNTPASTSSSINQEIFAVPVTQETINIDIESANGNASAGAMGDVDGELSVKKTYLESQPHVKPETKQNNPLILGFALFSAIIDDIKREIENSPKYILPDGRVLGCTRDGKAGRSMSVKTPRVKIVKSDALGPKKLGTKEILLVPIAPIARSLSDKNIRPLISPKYNPMNEFHDFVWDNSHHEPGKIVSNRDPFYALMGSLMSFTGFQVPKKLRKYDPVSNLDQIKSIQGRDENDPLVSLVKALSSFEGPKASHFLAKYDPLQGIEDIKPEEGTSEYSILQAMLNSNPHGASDYSVVQALLKATPDRSHYDVWKALVEVTPPESDDRLFKAINAFVDNVKKPLDIDLTKYDIISDLRNLHRDNEEQNDAKMEGQQQ